jgi:hypothetical protein
MAPPLLTSALMKVSGQLRVPAALPQEKLPRYHLHRRLRGLQNRSGHFEEDKDLSSSWI